MKQEFKTGIEKLGFSKTKEGDYELLFDNQLLTVKKVKGGFIPLGSSEVIFEWKCREYEDSDFSKLLGYVENPSIDDIEYVLDEATKHHHKDTPESEAAKAAIRFAKMLFTNKYEPVLAATKEELTNAEYNEAQEAIKVKDRLLSSNWKEVDHGSFELEAKGNIFSGSFELKAKGNIFIHQIGSGELLHFFESEFFGTRVKVKSIEEIESYVSKCINKKESIVKAFKDLGDALNSVTTKEELTNNKKDGIEILGGVPPVGSDVEAWGCFASNIADSWFVTTKEEAERIEDLEAANEALSNKIAELEDDLKQQEINHKKGVEIIEFALRGAESNFSIMNSNFQKVWNRLQVLEKRTKL